MTLVHELSPVSLNLEAGETVQSLFMMHVLLRTVDFDPQSIAGIEQAQGQTLDEQLADAQREKLQREIARLERLARAGRQPKKKLELVQQMKSKKTELESIS